VRLLRPFRDRDFALLWTGITVSLLGDGAYFVAVPWLVYQLANDPTALSLVGVAWTVPHLGCLLLGGAASDRFDRRRVMILSSLGSGVAIGAISLLVFADRIELWHLWILVALHGASFAFFVPASTAIVPQIVPSELLVEANSLRQFIRPLTLRLLGPALGGVLVAAFGTGAAFLVDALSFAFAAVVILLIRTRPRSEDRLALQASASFGQEIADGFRFVRSQSWLALSLVAAGLWLFVTVGPIEVLIPFLVKNEIGGGAETLGLVLAAGGVGAILGSILIGQRGRIPSRPLVFLYVAWATSTFAVGWLALANDAWQAMLASFFVFGLASVGGVVWQTLLQRRVPNELLGRVSSLDWLVSAGLVPLSFVLTGPIAASLGAEQTLLGAGLIGGALMLLFLVFPALLERGRPDELVSAPRTA
jgi:predicted MFS family arabinose efflux permease